jgi:hypothetical protein
VATEQEAVTWRQDLGVEEPCPLDVNEKDFRVPQVAVDGVSDFEGQLEELEGLLFVEFRRLETIYKPSDWRWNTAGFISY